MDRPLLRPLVLTGGPAVGKSTAARLLAESTDHCAWIDVDDVRQLVRNGGAAPWQGEEGLRQQQLGVINTAQLIHNFAAHGFDVTVSDVLTTDTLLTYRQLVPEVLVVRLSITLEQAERRAAARKAYLTSAEFRLLHDQQAQHLDVDVELDVNQLDAPAQVEAVRAVWQQLSAMGSRPQP